MTTPNGAAMSSVRPASNSPASHAKLSAAKRSEERRSAPTGKVKLKVVEDPNANAASVQTHPAAVAVRGAPGTGPGPYSA